MSDNPEIIRRLLNQFGEDAKITTIAQYAVDEYFMSAEEAVNLIFETVRSKV